VSTGKLIASPLTVDLKKDAIASKPISDGDIAGDTITADVAISRSTRARNLGG
jgi:hypothetical protein